MRGRQIVAIITLIIVIGAAGGAAQWAGNGLESTMISGNGAGSEGSAILNVPLNPHYGMYYRCHISTTGDQRFSVLFTNLSALMDARMNGMPVTYLADRSAVNVTSVTLEGKLPSSSDIFQLVIVSAEPGATVQISSIGEQGSFPPQLLPVLQSAYFICWVSNIFLFFLLIHVYGRYREERGPRC